MYNSPPPPPGATHCSLRFNLTKARFVCIVEGQVGARRGRIMLMPREASGLHPIWRFRHTLNQQKVTNGGPPQKKDVKNEGRSGNVYENKGPKDKLTEKMSGICARSKPILQKIRDFEGQIAVNKTFATCFFPNVEAGTKARQSRTQGRRMADLPPIYRGLSHFPHAQEARGTFLF